MNMPEAIQKRTAICPLNLDIWSFLFKATYILQSFGKLDNNGVGWRWDAVFLAKTQNTAVEGVYLGALSLLDVLKRGGMVGEDVRNQFPVEHVFVFLSVLLEGLKASRVHHGKGFRDEFVHNANDVLGAGQLTISLYFPQVY